MSLKSWFQSTLIAILCTCPQTFAATVRNHVFSLAAPASGAGCAAPLPIDYFQSTDPNLVFWVYLGGFQAGDSVVIRWATTAAVLDSTDKFKPLPSAGGYCFSVSPALKPNSPDIVGGTWNFEVLVNNASLLQTGTTVTSPNGPNIARGGVWNTASGTTNGGMLSAGTLVSITGTNLAPQSDAAVAAPLPTSLDGVSVTFNGAPVGIAAISPGEIDVQAPWAIGGDTALVQVTTNGVAGNVERVRIGSVSPGIFYDSTISAHAAVAYRVGADGGDGGAVGPSNPLRRGDTAIFFGTGFGAVSDPPPNYAIGNGDSRSILPLAVSFGGARSKSVSASVSTANDPLEVGVFWIFATVPDEVSNGSAIPVTIAVAGTPGNVVTVPVAGSVPNSSAATLTAVAPYPAVVNSSGTYNPGSAISISATGVATNVKTYVRFTDGHGYQISIPPLAVYTDRVLVTVPPYLDPISRITTSGQVSCSILQLVGGRLLESNATGIQIAPLYKAPGSVGRITAAYLATLAQDIRNIDGGYTYKREIGGGSRFQAVSTHQIANALTGALRPLIGGAEEVSAGAAKSVDLGTVNGRAISLDSNTLSLIDSVIAASLVETRKAYANPPVVRNGQQAVALNLVTESSFVGTLGAYFGKVAECNMSWEKLTEDLTHQQINCPTFGKALDDLVVNAKDSLRVALDSTAENARRFAGGVGFVLGTIVGDGAPAIVAKLATTAAFTQAVGHLALSLETSDPQAPADRKQAIEFFKDYFGEKVKDAFNDQIDDAGKALLKSFSPADVNSDADYDALKGLPIRDAVDATLALLRDATTTPEVPVDRANADGTNFLDTTLDGSPAVEISGKVTNGSGRPLQNTGVQLNEGDDSMPPIASGASLFDGSYDLPIPQSAIGIGVPNTAQLEVTTLDESGELATFPAKIIDLTRGSQSLNGISISYDSDDDGDDDSDGTNVRKPAKRAAMIGPKERPDNGDSAPQPTNPPSDARVRPARTFHRPAIAQFGPWRLGAPTGIPAR